MNELFGNQTMNSDSKIIEAIWEGPYSWPGYEIENKLPVIPNCAGVYLLTFEYKNGFLIYAAGITRRMVRARLKEHTRKYFNGEYNVLDLRAASEGFRKEIWHGWDYARNHRDEFNDQKTMILESVRNQLTGFRVFVASIQERRITERLEASIMATLYTQSSPICDLPDRGMHLAPKRKNEETILVKNICKDTLYGLPEILAM